MIQDTETDVARKTARHNMVSGAVLVGLAGFIVWNSFNISLYFVDEQGVGPRFFPQAIGSALDLIGLILLTMGFRGRVAPADKSTFEVTRLLFEALPLFAVGIAFVYAFEAFGYVVASFMALLVAARLFKVNFLEAILLAAIGSTVLYLTFFKLMTVFEPEATLYNPLIFLV